MSSPSPSYLFKSPIPDVTLPTLPLPEVILQSVGKYGDRVAFVDGTTGRELTYNQFIQQVHKVAAGLHAIGVKKGEVFGIYSPNVLEFGTFFHGVTKLGAIVSPANPLYTEQELEHQLKDSNAKYLITVSAFLEKAKKAAHAVGITKIFTFDTSSSCEDAIPFSTLLENDGKVLQVDIDPNDPIAIPYSSGTTGLPKGVVLTHRNLVANYYQIAAIETDMGEHPVDIGVLPFFHMYAMMVVLNLNLCVGGTTVVMSRFDLEKYLEIVQKYKVTYAHIVPPICVALAKHPIVDKYDLSSLKVVFSGAAPLSGDIEKAVIQRLKVKVKQAYGMTELSPASHITPTSKIKSGSVGILVPNCEAKVIDLISKQSLPPGKEGEICIRGPNVMKGYLNNPVATQNCLDDDGFLHTGDVGYVDEDGYFYIVDRVKELIKYKAYQVAPAELEAALLNHESIADVAVIPVPDEEAGELPKAYAVLKKDHKVQEQDIHQWLESRVAPYKKLRGGIEFVNEIPKSPSGKILRRLLVSKEKEKRVAQQQ